MPLGDVRSVFLPFVVERQPDGRYAILNREYKPVGFWTRSYVTYEDFPVLVKFKGLTPARAAKISYEGSTDTDRIYTIPCRERPSEYLAPEPMMTNPVQWCT